MNIRGYLPTSLIEWPGKIAAVAFVAGCNFRCPFCHNRDLVLASDDSPDFPDIPEKEVFADLKKRKKWIDGVVVTGGEPTLQKDLPEFLSRCKRMGLVTMLETNGSRPEVIKRLLVGESGHPERSEGSLVDFVAMDIKGPLDQRYLRIVKSQKSKVKSQNYKLKVKTLEDIKKSISLILNSGIPFEFRTTVVPTIHNKKNMVKLAQQLGDLIQDTRYKIQDTNWVLQNFQPKNCLNPEFNKIKPYSPKEMEEILAAVRKYIPEAELRG